MKDIFKPKNNYKIRPFDIIINAIKKKHEKFDNKSLSPLGPKIWNQFQNLVWIWMQMKCLLNHRMTVT